MQSRMSLLRYGLCIISDDGDLGDPHRDTAIPLPGYSLDWGGAHSQLSALFPPPIEQLVLAKRYYVSPVEEDGVALQSVLAYCMDFVLTHPEWQLSVQLHKLLGFR